MASQADAILDACVTLLRAVAWSPAPAVPFAVGKRKLLAAVRDDEAAVVVVARDGAEEVEKITAVRFLVRYPVAVGVAVKEAAKLGDTGPVLAWREQARDALLVKSLPGVAGFNVADPRPAGVAFGGPALDKGWTFTAIGFWFETLEARP